MLNDKSSLIIVIFNCKNECRPIVAGMSGELLVLETLSGLARIIETRDIHSQFEFVLSLYLISSVSRA